MAAPAIALTPLDTGKTVRRATFRRYSRPEHGARGETWEAYSADGRYAYLRQDEPGTPWAVRCLLSGRELLFAAATLRGARHLTSDPAWFDREHARREEEAARAQARAAEARARSRWTNTITY